MLKVLIAKLVNIIFPPKCLACYSVDITVHDSLCYQCWQKLEFITTSCIKCGNLLKDSASYDKYCLSCRNKRKNKFYTKIHSALLYNSTIKKLIKRFKYNNDLILKKVFVNWLLFAGKEILPEIDLIIPVPLHNQRLKQRKYNQAAILAKLLGKLSNKEVLVDGLIRKHNIESQSKLGYSARLSNVKNVFALNKKYKEKLALSSILLIDDVITTGATVNECAKVLRLEGKAKKIMVLTIARTSIFKNKN